MNRKASAGLGLIVILGAGGHGRVIADVVTRQHPSAERAFLDDFVDHTHVVGVPVMGKIDVLAAVLAEPSLRDSIGVIVGIGSNDVRRKIVHRVEGTVASSEATFVTAIDPSAVVSSHATLGRGTVAMPGVVVGTGASVGNHCILNTCCSVDHDCRIEDYVHLAPGVNLAGDVTIDEGTLVGTGSSVIPGVRIGKKTIIGAGSVVVGDIPDSVVAYGVPCRVVRNRT